MWPFKKPSPPEPEPEPKKPKKPSFFVIDYQIGDDVVCVLAKPHSKTHQNILKVGKVYRVTNLILQDNGEGHEGPWVTIDGVETIEGYLWQADWFRKYDPGEPNIAYSDLPIDAQDEIMRAMKEYKDEA